MGPHEIDYRRIDAFNHRIYREHQQRAAVANRTNVRVTDYVDIPQGTVIPDWEDLEGDDIEPVELYVIIMLVIFPLMLIITQLRRG